MYKYVHLKIKVINKTLQMCNNKVFTSKISQILQKKWRQILIQHNGIGFRQNSKPKLLQMGKIYMAKKARVSDRFQPVGLVNITNKQCICKAPCLQTIS